MRRFLPERIMQRARLHWGQSCEGWCHCHQGGGHLDSSGVCRHQMERAGGMLTGRGSRWGHRILRTLWNSSGGRRSCRWSEWEETPSPTATQRPSGRYTLIKKLYITCNIVLWTVGNIIISGALLPLYYFALYEENQFNKTNLNAIRRISKDWLK